MTQELPAVREASEISAMEDTVTDLDQDIEECATLAQPEAAAEQFPDALDGVNARTFAANRCHHCRQRSLRRVERLDRFLGSFGW